MKKPVTRPRSKSVNDASTTELCRGFDAFVRLMQQIITRNKENGTPIAHSFFGIRRPVRPVEAEDAIMKPPGMGNE